MSIEPTASKPKSLFGITNPIIKAILCIAFVIFTGGIGLIVILLAAGTDYARNKRKIAKNAISALMIASALSGCGGRTAQPVMISQFGDDRKSCRALEFEMSNELNEIQRLLPEKDKTGQNVALGVTGLFLIVPWFFMDFKGAEATEYEAHRQRYNHLGSIAMDKGCNAKTVNLPSIQQLEQEAQKQERQQSRNNQ